MIEISEVIAHLCSLVGRAAAGEDIVITKNGRPLARLVGAIDPVAQGEAAFARLKALRRGTNLGGLDWRRLRDEGRR